MNAQPQTATQSAATLQNAMQAALLKSTKEAEAKQAANDKQTAPVAQAKMRSIVVRKDRLGNFVVFDVDTHKKTEAGEFISAWDGKHITEAPIDYYKVATKPVTEEEGKKVSAEYAKAFKLTHINVRMRLEKNRIERDAAGQANTVDVNAFLDQLLSAVTKAINDMRV